MKSLRIRLYGERALFRNLSVPGADVASVDVSKEAVIGLLGNIMGKWRDFDDTNDFGLASELKAWISKHNLMINKINYPAKPEIRFLGQHRYKSVSEFTKEGNSGPKIISYHWGVAIDIETIVDEDGFEELIYYLRKPIGTPYLGQSNCIAQIELLSTEEHSIGYETESSP